MLTQYIMPTFQQKLQNILRGKKEDIDKHQNQRDIGIIRPGIKTNTNKTTKPMINMLRSLVEKIGNMPE